MTPRRYAVISGQALVRRLERSYGYEIVRQRGSHVRIRTMQNGKHALTVPDHKELARGTLDGILGAVAAHFGLTKDEVVSQLFE
jgi:predicted RNA binding protein YcfA (HicA-like mRNA interferase family)